MSVYIIAELGASHGGSVETAKRMIDMAVEAGCSAVKFQKRTLPEAIPEAQRGVMRETVWGPMTYLEYRQKLEFDVDAYAELFDYADDKYIGVSASVWDVQAVYFLRQFAPAWIKIPSAKLTDRELLIACARVGVPLIMSTGMSTEQEIKEAVTVVYDQWYREDGSEERFGNLTLLHCVSTYPQENEASNLRVMEWLRKTFKYAKIGYSGHERGLQISLAAVALGAEVIERHVTLDRASGITTDDAFALEPEGLRKLCRDIRIIEQALGTPEKRLLDCELSARHKLRGN